ncbi:MAG: hypothetical protein H7317_11450 [Pseudorhodobacter sp.]|nr:hypothetical protein [Pseudorhodobacter sp.]
MFCWSVFFSNFAPLLWAAGYTLLISVLGIALGLVIGALVCAARLSRSPGVARFGDAVWTIAICAIAYISEIWRGAIMALPRGQTEAADAIGMAPVTQRTRINLPQAIVMSLPALINELIRLVKASSLVIDRRHCRDCAHQSGTGRVELPSA